MLWAIVVILFLLWLFGFLVIHVTSALIHLLLIAAIIVLVVSFVTGSRSRSTV